MVAISDDWLAYCFDEVCYYLTANVYDPENYSYNWDLLNFEDSERLPANNNINQTFMDFIEKEGGKYD